MGLLVVVLLPDNLVLLVSDLILGQSLLFVVPVLLGDLHSLDDPVDFFLGLFIDLLLLEVQVLIDHPGHGLYVWESLLVVLFHDVGRLLDVLPALHLLVQAEVSQHRGWAPRDTGGAMDEHFVVLVLQDILDNLGTLEELAVVVLAGVINVAVLDDVDAILLIEVEHVVVGNLPLLLLDSGHQVDDSGDSILSQDSHVLLVLRIRADGDPSVRYWGNSEVSQEVTVALFNDTVDEEHLGGHPLVVGLGISEESIVFVWILDVEHSHGVSFDLITASRSSYHLVMVVEVGLIGGVDALLGRELADPLGGLIGSYILSILLIEPVVWSLGSLHLDWAQFDKVSLVCGNEEDGVIILIGVGIWRMENSESNFHLLPSVVQLNELLKAAVHVLSSLTEVDTF